MMKREERQPMTRNPKEKKTKKINVKSNVKEKKN